MFQKSHFHFMNRKEEPFMHKYYLKSIYAPYIEEFTSLKRDLGYKYKTGSTILAAFDRFVIENGFKEVGITQDIVCKWQTSSSNDSPVSRYMKVQILADFSSFLCKKGICSYIPRLLPYVKSSFTPYIYSHVEMKRIFEFCDKLHLVKNDHRSPIFCIPVLIRFLYATGIRIGEAITLKNEDLELEQGYVIIRESKNGKERLIPLSESLLNVCREYARQKSKLPINQRESVLFFLGLNGNKCSHSTITAWFRKILHGAGIPFRGDKQGPRIHDLRHTFAVHSLAAMVKAGNDFYSSMPVLSTMLGHSCFTSTNEYVRLTAEIYPELIKDVNVISLHVFPKIKSYETY